MAVIQFANYASLPVIFLTFIPFYRIGNRLFGHRIPSGNEIMAMFNYDDRLNITGITTLMANAMEL